MKISELIGKADEVLAVLDRTTTVPRQKQVIARALSGEPIKSIASDMGISTGRVYGMVRIATGRYKQQAALEAQAETTQTDLLALYDYKLTPRARNGLRNFGITTRDQLVREWEANGDANFRTVPNFGKTTMAEICRVFDLPIPAPPVVYGFDMAAGFDTACLVIARKTPDGVLHIEKEVFGAEAAKLAKRLKLGPF